MLSNFTARGQIHVAEAVGECMHLQPDTCVMRIGRMELGDVSWHHGWLLHYAPPQPLNSPPRMALAVSYFGDGARIRRVEWSGGDCMLEDKESYADWVGPRPGQLQRGAVARHALLPVIDVR